MVLQIGEGPGGLVMVPSRYDSVTPVPALFRSESLGVEVTIPNDLPEELRELVKRELLPQIDTEVERQRIAPLWLAAGYGTDRYLPLLHDLDGYAFAAIYRPDAGLRECLYLHENVTNLAPWLRYAFKRWAEESPEIFPSQPEWRGQPTWMTARELRAADDLATKQREFEAVVAEHQRGVELAHESLSHARDDSDRHERLLLTAEGTDLEEAVMSTLRELGFAVRLMDTELTAGQARKEDLRVSQEQWTAVCEVKGYGKGAKASDLNRFTNIVGMYTMEIGSMPNAMWYVVNQFRFDPPDSRSLALASHEDQLGVFAAGSGLVIDTRDLFQLSKAVSSGKLTRDSARQLMMTASGRFRYSGG